MSPDRQRPFSERAIVAAVLIGAAIAVALLLGLRSIGGGSGSPLKSDLAEKIPPSVFVERTAQRWVDAWIAGDTASMRKLALAPATGLEDKVASFRDGLHITALRASPRTPTIAGSVATVEMDVAADLAGLGTWVYTGSLSLVLPADAASPGDWRVTWSRQALHPGLTGERRLGVTRSFPPRAQLLAADGTPLTGAGAAPTIGLARQLIGRLGPADATRANDLGSNVYLAGDTVGVSGLQAAFERDVAGTPTGDVQLLDGGTVVGVVGHVDGKTATSFRTSIDLRVQSAAEAVLASVADHATALVAIRPSTGEVEAIASTPVQGFNRALQGRYPPGSTFKVITSTALLMSGITPDSPTTCPLTVKINGREFSNAEDEQLGDIPFRLAFAHSCNTAFVQLAEKLQASELTAAAELLGFNKAPSTEVPAEVPSFPEPHGMVDQVSSAIGQGRVLTTPLQMASVAATVASGTRRPTTFRQVTVPPPGEPLPAGVAATLQALMRLVVTDGTGQAARMPGQPVAGKTGTAEFGHDDPPHTHAWFIGFRGDLAFAVLVEDGGFGGKVAAPLARQFLQQLG